MPAMAGRKPATNPISDSTPNAIQAHRSRKKFRVNLQIPGSGLSLQELNQCPPYAVAKCRTHSYNEKAFGKKPGP